MARANSLAAAFVLVTSAYAGNCEDLAKLARPNTTITAAKIVTSGSFAPPTGAPLTNLPAFCRIAATLRPTSDSDIQVEMWMPRSAWNARLEGTGNGGFAGKISYTSLATGLKRNYAVINTDMGMSTPADADAAIFTGHSERWADWGYRATHEMTLFAKDMVKAFYGKDPARSYFVGCSTGGEQALMEAQRFPDDYDGIVGGAPANNRTHVHTSILWNFAVTQRDPAAYIPPAKLPLIANAVLAACDSLDGVRDGVISDPRKCNFKPASLQCKGAETNACLTRPQVEAMQRLYAGPANPRTGEKLYPGLPPGSEFGWNRLGPDPASKAEPPYAPIFKWVFGRDWKWQSFDFDRSMATVDSKLAATLNANSTNLDAFRRSGHKLLVYHGWADWLVMPGESINYYNSMVAKAGKVDDFYRLFMLPGVAHCTGGPGADNTDPLSAVVDWVEHSTAPEKLIATKYSTGQNTETVLFQRLICPYPQAAKYSGTGDTNKAASYSCALPSGAEPRKQLGTIDQ